MNRFLSVVFTLAVATVAITHEARALGPVDLEVGARVGGATNPRADAEPPNPLGIGLGGRAGLAFLGGFYAGGTIIYYLGGSNSSAGGPTNDPNVGRTIWVHTLMYGGELGYGIKLLDLLTIRPQVGLGNATFMVSDGSTSEGTSYWYLEPGVTALLGFGTLYVGADANALFFPSLPNNRAAFSMHAQVGVTL